MGYSETRRLCSRICELLDKHNMKYSVHHSRKSSSMYIKIGNPTIRVSDHYSSTDNYCKYNIGPHICRFKKEKNSLYYRADRPVELVKRVVKDWRNKDGKTKIKRRNKGKNGRNKS